MGDACVANATAGHVQRLSNGLPEIFFPAYIMFVLRTFFPPLYQILKLIYLTDGGKVNIMSLLLLFQNQF
jgi:hypothetical protein